MTKDKILKPSKSKTNWLQKSRTHRHILHSTKGNQKPMRWYIQYSRKNITANLEFYIDEN